MKATKTRIALFSLFALGIYTQSALAEQYDPPVAIVNAACPDGSTGYGNARFAVFPLFNNPLGPNYRLTVWCGGGGGRRMHYKPTTNVFSPWVWEGGAWGVGWPPPSSYGNQYYVYDIDSDGDLDVFRLVETSPNNWTVYLSRML